MNLATGGLATYRLTRLLTRDTILTKPRTRLLLWAMFPVDGRSRHPKVVELLSCTWCASIWAAVALLVAYRLAPRPTAFLARLLAFSAVAGIISEQLAPNDTDSSVH